MYTYSIHIVYIYIYIHIYIYTYCVISYAPYHGPATGPWAAGAIISSGIIMSSINIITDSHIVIVVLSL